MSGERLREAAVGIRNEWADAEKHIKPTAFYLAVADWLEAAYADWHREEHSLGAMSVRAMSGGTNEPDPTALAVADAYLGSAS